MTYRGDREKSPVLATKTGPHPATPFCLLIFLLPSSVPGQEPFPWPHTDILWPCLGLQVALGLLQRNTGLPSHPANTRQDSGSYPWVLCSMFSSQERHRRLACTSSRGRCKNRRLLWEQASGSPDDKRDCRKMNAQGSSVFVVVTKPCHPEAPI